MKAQERVTFRETVFTRDNHKCIVPSCGREAVDAHHLIERKLWEHSSEKGGYLVNNGVSLCGLHHELAERNVICPQVLRIWAKIDKLVLPKGLDKQYEYDKWGSIIDSPNRKWVKYPSTSYLPFSENIVAKKPTSNPISNVDDFVQIPLVVTMKMDGSNVVLTNHHVAARNGYDARHASFDMLKSIHANLKSLIPEHIQVFGEWLYAKHSIHYKDRITLDAYLQVFGVYNTNTNIFLGWSEVQEMAKRLGYMTPPVLFTGYFNTTHEFINGITTMAKQKIKGGHEGLVVRSVFPFHYGQFAKFLSKYVRPNHVQTPIHWRNMRIVKNELKE